MVSFTDIEQILSSLMACSLFAVPGKHPEQALTEFCEMNEQKEVQRSMTLNIATVGCCREHVTGHMCGSHEEATSDTMERVLSMNCTSEDQAVKGWLPT